MDALDKIALEATGLESEAQAKEDAILNPEPANQVDPAAAWAALPKMFGGILAIAMPELEKEYSDERCYAWGGAMSQVAEKHGWDAAETMSRFAPEIALVMATIPLALPTVKAIKARKTAAEKAEKLAAAAKTAEDAQNVQDIPQGGGFDEPK